MWCAFFLLFTVKKCTKKGNHLCSSLLNLKMTFHQHSPFLISNCEIWSHCFKILVPSVWPNHFFCPTFFRTMNDKSSSSCVSSNDVANLGCDIASVISTILCFAYLPRYLQTLSNLFQAFIHFLVWLPWMLIPKAFGFQIWLNTTGLTMRNDKLLLEETSSLPSMTRTKTCSHWKLWRRG